MRSHIEISGALAFKHVLQRRMWLLLMALIVLPLLAVVLSLRQAPLYQSTAQVLLKYQNLAGGVTGIQDTSGVFQDPARIAATQAKLAMVPTVAHRVIATVGLKHTTAQEFLAEASVAVEGGADILDFRFIARHPSLAARLATEHARQFIGYRRELDTAAIVRAESEVRQQIKQFEASGATRSGAYSRLIESQQKLRTMAALQTSNASLVDVADGAAQIRPRPVRNGIYGFALGLILGLALAFLAEALDTRVRTATEVSEQLALPLLARLPETPRRLRAKNRLTMLADPQSTQAEAVRLLRTSIEFANLDRGARTIMITSALQQEGKSTTIANLAVADARAGKRVLLIDLDLRRPSIHRFFGLEGRSGLTDVVLGNALLDQVLEPVAIPAAAEGRGKKVENNGRAQVGGMLHVLTSGPIPPDPGEFIGSGRLTSLLNELRERADVVYIDAPPLLHLGDALALSSKVDGLIVVTRLNFARRPLLKELSRVLDTVPAARLGFVLTSAGLEEGYGYGSYGYYAASTVPTARVEERT